MSIPSVVGWLTVPEASELAHLSEWTLRKEIREGRLVACRVGKCVRLRPADLEAWMESRRVVKAS